LLCAKIGLTNELLKVKVKCILHLKGTVLTVSMIPHETFLCNGRTYSCSADSSGAFYRPGTGMYFLPWFQDSTLSRHAVDVAVMYRPHSPISNVLCLLWFKSILLKCHYSETKGTKLNHNFNSTAKSCKLRQQKIVPQHCDASSCRQ